VNTASTAFELDYTRKVNTAGLALLAVHLPVLCLIATFTDKSPLAVAGFMLVLLLGPAVLLFQDRASSLAAIALAIAAMGTSALAIYVANGMIEAHFELFVLIAMLAVFGRVAPVVVAGVTIALHHILFWLWLPADVFNYKASFLIVLVHAFFVILEVIPCCYIARALGKANHAQGIVLEHLGGAADSVASSSREITSASAQLANAASKQAATIEETSASAVQMNQVSQQNSDASDGALHSMTDMDLQLQNANAGLQTMQKVIHDMVVSGKAIGSVIKLIDGIAFQTNILSLNAAVEAASAGVYGAGFSVVAKEVGSLAQKSATAATDTAALIEVSLKNTQTGEAAIEALRLAMDRVNGTAGLIKTHIAVLESTAHEQLKAGSHISRSMQQLGDSAQQTAAGAEQAAATALSLDEQARTLREVVTLLAH
jgi:hypothetical protein